MNQKTATERGAAMAGNRSSNPRGGWRGARPGLLLFLPLILVVLGAGAYFFWRDSGAVRFTGTLTYQTRVLGAPAQGVIARLFVNTGGSVRSGDTLLVIDEASLRAERDRTAALAAAAAAKLPPEALTLLPDGRIGPLKPGQTSLPHMLDNERARETQAARAVQDASDEAARADIAYSRYAVLYAKSKIDASQLEQARSAQGAVREKLTEAKAAFEKTSLGRARLERELARVRASLAASGADALPGKEREDAYRAYARRLEELDRRLDLGGRLSAPEDGSVAQVVVVPGQNVALGDPCLVFLADSDRGVVSAQVPAKDAALLAPGQICLVDLIDTEHGDVRLPGRIREVLPGTAGDGARVIAVLTPQAGQKAPHAPGARAEVTVMVRRPVELPLEPVDETPLSEQAPAPPGAAAPPVTPVRLPDGGSFSDALQKDAGTPAPDARRTRPVLIEAGSPEARGQVPAQEDMARAGNGHDSGPANGVAGIDGAASPSTRPLPVLPPMRAPYPLKGTAKAHPGNNPSIVPHEVLEGAPARP